MWLNGTTRVSRKSRLTARTIPTATLPMQTSAPLSPWSAKMVPLLRLDTISWCAAVVPSLSVLGAESSDVSVPNVKSVFAPRFQTSASWFICSGPAGPIIVAVWLPLFGRLGGAKGVDGTSKAQSTIGLFSQVVWDGVMLPITTPFWEIVDGDVPDTTWAQVM